MNRLAILTLVLCGLFVVAADSLAETSSTSLFNGKDLAGWHADVPKLDNKPDTKRPFIARGGRLRSRVPKNRANSNHAAE